MIQWQGSEPRTGLAPGEEIMNGSSDVIEDLRPILSRIADAMSEAVLIVDPAEVVVVANQAAAQLLDLADPAAALRPLGEYNHLMTGGRVGEDFPPDVLRRSLQGKTVSRQMATITTSAGNERTMEFTTTPIRGEGGQVALAMLIASDVTSEQRNREQLKQVADDLREANQQLVIAGVREQELAEEAERHTAQLNALIESMSEGVTIVDATGRVVLMNSAGRETFPLPPTAGGWTLDDYHKLDLRRLDASPLPVAERPISRALRGERFADYEVILVRADQSQRRIVFSGSAIRDDAGNVMLAVNVYRDVTELRELEQMRDEYTALISHDLRSPLTALMGQAQWLSRLLGQKRLEREAHSAEAILTSARRMNAMIQDLVESTRLTSRQYVLHREPTDLLQLISDIVERVGSPADRTRLRVESPEWVPPVAADPGRIERAIVNLITNGLKYSPPDRPVVIRLDRGDGEAIVSVVDQGVGISPQDLPRIFEKFYRAWTGAKREGLGLGLYITRLIVEAHGGRIWAESEVGKGSSFHIALPMG